ncbi:Protein N-acetyltransferase, RimJ/RimL family [Selenomonas ruminantium]|uniref:Protein N-acetyltransferase, RimJ/RimL family n=1 Tax=Selenomonas ruminantium TaxID=971 RepID=A0A1I3C1P5_SELRU|nr:GNAT family protein [Selenomonas ruminantium]SFH68353.1 Protein N-acetyltransferase, RimJ/RimL family [Selenomonas ruminantium]
MIALRRFALSDAVTIQSKRYPAKTQAEIAQLIHEWNKTTYSGRRFAMLAIAHGDEIVGSCSWFEHSKSVASFGVEVWEGERKKGYAFMALTQLQECVRENGFAIVQDQVRADNVASIRLHEKLQFETDGYIYKNQKGGDVLLYLKALTGGQIYSA